MTKKDYELIARVLNVTYNTLKNSLKDYPKKSRENGLSTGGIMTVEMIAEAMSTALASENPRFEKERFISAVISKK